MGGSLWHISDSRLWKTATVFKVRVDGEMAPHSRGGIQHFDDLVYQNSYSILLWLDNLVPLDLSPYWEYWR